MILLCIMVMRHRHILLILLLGCCTVMDVGDFADVMEARTAFIIRFETMLYTEKPTNL
jgi:hypothetical protein